MLFASILKLFLNYYSFVEWNSLLSVLSLAMMSQSQSQEPREWPQFNIWDFLNVFLVGIQTQGTFNHWFLSQAAKGFLWHSSHQNSALKQLLISLSFITNQFLSSGEYKGWFENPNCIVLCQFQVPYPLITNK